MSLDGTFDDWSDRDSHETSSASDTSSSFVQNNMQRLSYQPEAGDIAAASHSLDTDQSTQSAIHTPSISTRSRGSDGISRSPCDGSVCSFPPHRSAPRDLADASASTSRLSDPILEHIASHTSLAARTASLTGQTADSGSLPSSAGSTESDETDSQSTPDTSTSSEATQEADHISLLDAGHHDHAAGILDRASSLLGLGLPGEEQMSRRRCMDEYADLYLNSQKNHEIDLISATRTTIMLPMLPISAKSSMNSSKKLQIFKLELMPSHGHKLRKIVDGGTLMGSHSRILLAQHTMNIIPP
jgi:hypothetical protein